jgi:hypothetical protein
VTPPSALDMDVAQADYDALADLFLADAYPALNGAAPTVAPSNSRTPALSPTLHAVIAGHLPVLASAWVTQYARHQADTSKQPVALLRLAGGQALIDLVLPSGHKLPTDASPRPGAPLPEALAAIAARYPRWVIRVDEAAESDLFRQPLASIALLTGADDPAVVASFQTLKGLSLSLPDTPPPLELVIMGAPTDKADAAESKLRRACATFFDALPPAATRIPRIHSSVTLQLYRAPTTATLDDIVAAIQAPAPTSEPIAKAPTTPPPSESVREVHNGHVPHPPAITALPNPQSPIPSPQSLPPSLSALPFTCPYAHAITFALDPQGALHLVAQQSISPADASQRLLTAAAWANDHKQLLTAAAPALKDHQATLHILTADARTARPLLDTGLKLHLVTPSGLHPLN